MPISTQPRLAFNLPLLVLWVAGAGLVGLGTWMVLTGNSAQGEFYTAGGSDALELLSLQSKVTIGGLLLVAGVLGLLLALATHARAHSSAILATRVATDAAASEPGASDDFDDFDADALEDDELDAERPADAAPSTEPSAATAHGLGHGRRTAVRGGAGRDAGLRPGYGARVRHERDARVRPGVAPSLRRRALPTIRGACAPRP